MGAAMTAPRFDLVTEVDARSLDYGTTIILNPGGRITPLAADTLRDRRVTVLQHDVDVDLAALQPAHPVRRVAVGSDHTGVRLRRLLVSRLRATGLAVREIGPAGVEPADYPDIALAVAGAVAAVEVDAGIVIDGAGLGSAIAANKVPGIRAAACHDRTLARYAREHNGAQVLALGATIVSDEDAEAVVDVFLATPMTEPRYLRRLAKLRHYEQTR